eukprot:CAMPEP_0176243816 /NCGR_PEP_ID=MMETSP0121_2-20121125/31116_1 /TAXON_ID=160619 /ORGANISM="Kryptoperidinium foliaceum, Strain CCMP 1326" /LENGTH=323 /DNA_ID=CAMNT_0017583415 /DNA_START=623 /DNA_END=1591 /DNA_ORIENTATION=+
MSCSPSKGGMELGKSSSSDSASRNPIGDASAISGRSSRCPTTSQSILLTASPEPASSRSSGTTAGTGACVCRSEGVAAGVAGGGEDVAAFDVATCSRACRCPGGTISIGVGPLRATAFHAAAMAMETGAHAGSPAPEPAAAGALARSKPGGARGSRAPLRDAGEASPRSRQQRWPRRHVVVAHLPPELVQPIADQHLVTLHAVQRRRVRVQAERKEPRLRTKRAHGAAEHRRDARRHHHVKKPPSCGSARGRGTGGPTSRGGSVHADRAIPGTLAGLRCSEVESRGVGNRRSPISVRHSSFASAPVSLDLPSLRGQALELEVP